MSPAPIEFKNGRPSAATLAIHGDNGLNKTSDVAPALHVSTTFRYSEDPNQLVPAADEDTDLTDLSTVPYVYSRIGAPNSTRLETLLEALFTTDTSKPVRTLTYASGLAAFYALLCFYNPKVVAIGEAYHGCHGALQIYKKLTGCKIVDIHDEASWDAAGLGKQDATGSSNQRIDLVHLETPVNPRGIAYNIAQFAERAHSRGAILSIDSTFAPPGLQDPFSFGADVIMHSGTKYVGGHSDMLCGILAVQKRDWYEGLWKERMYLGSVMGNLEGWLGVRSLRTIELRVQRQSRNAGDLVRWIDQGMRGENADAELIQKNVYKVEHASLQKEDMEWLSKQMPNGFGPVFALWMKSEKLARTLPSKLNFFHHATSLGGVESLVEWRRMSDATVDERVIRVSVGVEAVEDLINDLREAFLQLV